MPAVRAAVAADDRTLLLDQFDDQGQSQGVISVDLVRRDLAIAVAAAVNTWRPANPARSTQSPDLPVEGDDDHGAGAP